MLAVSNRLIPTGGGEGFQMNLKSDARVSPIRSNGSPPAADRSAGVVPGGMPDRRYGSGKNYKPSPSGFPGSLPAMLFVEENDVNLTPQDCPIQEPEDSILIQIPPTVPVGGNPQVASTANSRQKENPLILGALPPGGMKSPCASAGSVYQNRETKQERDEWLEAIARDDERERKA
jgi:hypothetical protein